MRLVLKRALLLGISGALVTAIAGAFSGGDGFATGGLTMSCSGLTGCWVVWESNTTFGFVSPDGQVVVPETTTHAIEAGPDLFEGIAVCATVGTVAFGVGVGVGMVARRNRKS